MMNNEEREEAKVLFATIRILYPKYHPFWFIFYMYVWYIKTVKRKVKYSVQPVPIDFMKKIAGDEIYFNDINSTIIVNPENIYVDEILLKLHCNKTILQTFVYPVANSVCPKDELLVSDTFFYNLINLNLINNVRLLNYNITNIKFANEINITLINCPIDINNSLSDAILDRFFEIPKLIRKGDIIEIDIRYIAEDIFFLNSKLNNVNSIFFKCNKVIYKDFEATETFYCVIGETAIKQGANIQSFLPKKKGRVVLKCNRDNQKLTLVPNGLNDYFENINTAVKPFMKKVKFHLKPVFLMVGNNGSGKELLVSSLAAHLGMHFYRIDNFELMASVYAQNETKLHNAFFNAKMAAPCIVCMYNFENFGKNNDGQYDERIMGSFADELEILFEKNSFPIILFCCTNQKNVPSDLQALFLETFEISALTENQREENLKWICAERNLKCSNLDQVANRTHGFFFEDLKALVYYAQKISEKKLLDRKETIIIKSDHFFEAVDYMQKNYNDSIGAPKVPKVLWSDVGGLSDVKEEIIKTIHLPLKHPELVKKSGLRRSGILLFGPPGTGKTLIAKAVATECSLCFLSVKGPELLNMYVGQSEQNIREVFERARAASPSIIFFDELDSLAPNRGLSGDSGGVMDRVVSQLLAEMDGLNESATVFIIGATNRPDLIDPALLRPGRFDKLLYIGPCTDETSKTSVLKALTKKFILDNDVDLAEIVRICPKNITGADFYGICSNAWLSAVRRLVNEVEKGDVLSEEVVSNHVIVNFDDFKQAMVDVKPSITPEDLLYFQRLKKDLL